MPRDVVASLFGNYRYFEEAISFLYQRQLAQRFHALLMPLDRFMNPTAFCLVVEKSLCH